MHPTSWRGHYCRSEVEIGQHVVLAVIDERGQLQPRANVNRRTRDVEFARDSSVEGSGFELSVPLRRATASELSVPPAVNAVGAAHAVSGRIARPKARIPKLTARRVAVLA